MTKKEKDQGEVLLSNVLKGQGWWLQIIYQAEIRKNYFWKKFLGGEIFEYIERQECYKSKIDFPNGLKIRARKALCHKI